MKIGDIAVLDDGKEYQIVNIIVNPDGSTVIVYKPASI